MNSFFSNLNIFLLINKWKKHLLILIGVSVILTFIFSSSFFIKPRYRSEAILYPSNLSPYSSESPTEQMLQYFRSDDIKDSMISKFHLIKYWKVDSTRNHYKTILYNIFNDNIVVKKSDNESVIIEAVDINPDTACKMVKSMIQFFNLKVRSLHKEKLIETAKTLEFLLTSKKKQIDSLESRLDTLRKKYNILDYDIQLKEAMRQRVKENNEGKTVSSSLLKNLENYGGEYQLLGGYLSSATGIYNKILSEYEKTQSDIKKEITYTNIISSPKIPDKKCYPIRWLIVLIGAASTFLLSIIVIGMIDNFKKPEN